MTDWAVTVVFFAVVFLLVIGGFALIESIVVRRERKASREWNRRLRQSR